MSSGAEQGPRFGNRWLFVGASLEYLTSARANARLRLTRDVRVLDRLDFIYERCRAHGNRSMRPQWYLAQMWLGTVEPWQSSAALAVSAHQHKLSRCASTTASSRVSQPPLRCDIIHSKILRCRDVDAAPHEAITCNPVQYRSTGLSAGSRGCVSRFTSDGLIYCAAACKLLALPLEGSHDVASVITWDYKVSERASC